MSEVVKTIKVQYEGNTKALKDVNISITNRQLVRKVGQLFSERNLDVSAITLLTASGVTLSEENEQDTVKSFIESKVQENQKNKKYYKKLCLVCKVNVKGGK